MSGKMRSPKYPSTPLEQAIEYIDKIHSIERANPIDREVAAKALGYSGISGRSATVLASLIQYGLLEKAGKNEVRVTDRAVEILYPDNPTSRRRALKDAAENPTLFQQISARFTDGLPSENALRSFFVKEGFTNTAIPAAIKAFQETFSYLENTIEYGSHSDDADDVIESQPNQQVEGVSTMHVQTKAASRSSNQPVIHSNPIPQASPTGPEYHFIDKKIWLGGVVMTKADAEDVITYLTAVKPMLADAEVKPVETGDDVSEPDPDFDILS